METIVLGVWEFGSLGVWTIVILEWRSEDNSYLGVKESLVFLRQQLGEEHIAEEDQDAARHYCAGARLAYLNRTAFDIITEI